MNISVSVPDNMLSLLMAWKEAWYPHDAGFSKTIQKAIALARIQISLTETDRQVMTAKPIREVP